MVSPVYAQRRNGDLLVGIAGVTGVGAEGAYALPRSVYTLEGVLYVDTAPRFAGGEGSVLLSGAVGGAVRVFGILRTVGNPNYATRDLDVGIRFGPSLFFTLGESSREENPFSLFLEPYVRFISTFGTSRTLFLELGTQRPIVRAGIVLQLRASN